MKKLKFMCLVAFLFLFYSAVIMAQDNENLKNESEFINYDEFDIFKNKERKVEVSIKPPLLKLVSIAAAKEDPELAKIIENIDLIKVDIFPVDESETKDFMSISNKVLQQMKSKNWESIIHIKEPNEQVDILIKYNGANVSGFVIMIINKKEAVFVNILGNIDLEQLTKLSGKFNIPKMDNLNINNEEKK